MDYERMIETFRAESDQEAEDQETILAYIQGNRSTVLYRENKIAHMTSSGFIMNPSLDKVLMVYHRIYDSWSWTGGHSDGERDLLKTALKEAEEETGVETFWAPMKELLSLAILPVPAHYKGGRYFSVHLHFAPSFLLLAEEDCPLRMKEDENAGVRWLDADALERYVTEREMLPVYQRLIGKARALRRSGKI